MSVESTTGIMPVYPPQEKELQVESGNTMYSRKKMIAFFRNLNPANWFDELSNISITMEELGDGKP